MSVKTSKHILGCGTVGLDLLSTHLHKTLFRSPGPVWLRRDYLPPITFLPDDLYHGAHQLLCLEGRLIVRFQPHIAGRKLHHCHPLLPFSPCDRFLSIRDRHCSHHHYREKKLLHLVICFECQHQRPSASCIPLQKYEKYD